MQETQSELDSFSLSRSMKEGKKRQIVRITCIHRQYKKLEFDLLLLLLLPERCHDKEETVYYL